MMTRSTRLTRDRLGLRLPSIGPGSSLAAIEETAGLATTLGWASVWASDHLVVERGRAAQYGVAFDALTTLAYVAGRYPALRIGTNVLVAPLRNAISLAKELATLDLLSRGRLTVGVGIGTGSGEYRNLGTGDRFAVRGAYLNEAIRLWRHLWSGATTPFEGRFHSLDDYVFAPLPSQSPIPIWSGGRSDAALQRAASLSDGYLPGEVEPDGLGPLLERLRMLSASVGRPMPQIGLRVDVAYADLERPQVVVDHLASLVSEGVDHLIVGFTGDPPADREQAIERLSDQIEPGATVLPAPAGSSLGNAP